MRYRVISVHKFHTFETSTVVADRKSFYISLPLSFSYFNPLLLVPLWLSLKPTFFSFSLLFFVSPSIYKIPNHHPWCCPKLLCALFLQKNFPRYVIGEETIGFNVSDIIKGGSLGHGTAVEGNYDLDLVLYSQGMLIIIPVYTAKWIQDDTPMSWYRYFPLWCPSFKKSFPPLVKKNIPVLNKWT